jgi:hypothetical protein
MIDGLTWNGRERVISISAKVVFFLEKFPSSRQKLTYQEMFTDDQALTGNIGGMY